MPTKRNLDNHPSIDLLFTGIVMAEMTGRELSEIARQKRPDRKVLYATGFTRLTPLNSR